MTPEEIAELKQIAEASVASRDDKRHAVDDFLTEAEMALARKLDDVQVLRLIAHVEKVTEQRDELDESYDRDLSWRYNEAISDLKRVRQERDELQARIDRALDWCEERAEDWGNGIENILSAPSEGGSDE